MHWSEAKNSLPSRSSAAGHGCPPRSLTPAPQPLHFDLFSAGGMVALLRHGPAAVRSAYDRFWSLGVHPLALHPKRTLVIVVGREGKHPDYSGLPSQCLSCRSLRHLWLTLPSFDVRSTEVLAPLTEHLFFRNSWNSLPNPDAWNSVRETRTPMPGIFPVLATGVD